jgi:hypothetical protein
MVVRGGSEVVGGALLPAPERGDGQREAEGVAIHAAIIPDAAGDQAPPVPIVCITRLLPVIADAVR